MKTIKIFPQVHTELKTYAAINNINMEVYASQAILKLLKEDGHKFIYPIKKEKIKTAS